MNQTIDGILKEVFEVLMAFHHVVYRVTPSVGSHIGTGHVAVDGDMRTRAQKMLQKFIGIG
jgi:hypothetical protein